MQYATSHTLKTEKRKGMKLMRKIKRVKLSNQKGFNINIPYVVSLPERFIRSSVSLVTSFTTLVSTLLFPKFLKDSATYRVTYGMLQQFLVEKVAGVQQENKEFQLKKNYVARKTAGTVIEGIGMLSVRFSPIWMLAIISDISGGSKEYLERVLKELKKNHLIDENTSYSTVFELLDGIQSTTKVGVDAIDMPPVSKEDFIEFKEKIQQQYHQNSALTKSLFTELENIYTMMNQVSKDKKLSLAELNGAMTLNLMKAGAKKGVDISVATTKTSLAMLNELILDNYKDTLQDLSKHGKRSYLINHMTPFMKQVKNYYKEETPTITQKLLNFGRKK